MTHAEILAVGAEDASIGRGDGARLQAVRTGRASTALVERIQVEYYGTPNAAEPDRRHQHARPAPDRDPRWDRSVLSAIERALIKSEIGLTPNVDGTVVRLNVPPLTEDRRREMVDQVRKRAEEARVELRVHRRDVADHLKKGLRDGSLSEDEERRELEALQR